MAKRLNPRHQESVRAKIQAAHLIRLLQMEAKGDCELKKGQRESAMFLLNKSLANPPADTNLHVDGKTNITVRGV